MKNKNRPASSSEAGTSIVEIVIALVIIAILSAISLPYVVNYKKLYKSEDQALKMMDLMREAAQLAVTERRTIRFEIDLTDNAVLLIDQSLSASGNLIKKIPLEETKEVRVDVIPDGIIKPYPNYNDITFTVDTVGHLAGTTAVNGHNIWAARFKRDGSVTNLAETPISANIYVWPPISPGTTEARHDTEIRAITMFGGSGAVRYWKYDSNDFVPNQ